MRLLRILESIKRSKHLAEYTDYLIESVFFDPVNENDKTDVVNALKAGLDEVSAEEFKESMAATKHPQMLTQYSTSDLAKMKLYKVPGENIGFALKRSEATGKHDEIVAVHNNSDIRGVGQDIMKAAIKAGGCYLDHFDVPQLSGLYSKMGFEEYDRSKFDPKYMDDDSFEKKYGKADVIYRVHKSCGKP